MPSVLIVDDLLSIHEMLEAVIQPIGYSTAFATDGQKALERYKAEKYDLVLADIDMKPMDGITLLRQLKAYDPSAVVIIMTAYASTESAVQALKFGAYDYLQKPFRVDDLISTLKRAYEYRKLVVERPTTMSGTNSPLAEADPSSALAGAGPAHQKLVQQVRKLIGVRTPVLLQGEPGTGKSTIAGLLHAGRIEKAAPMVRVDCALGCDDTFHEKLLGANGSGGAWLDQARGGTLLLQNLDRLPPEMQPELVAVLRAQGHAFRLVCTATKDLERMTEEGEFDDELFYRVAALPIVLQPLRERVEDIPAMVRYFTAKAVNPGFASHLVEFNPEALALLQAHSWPGNVTDLGQVVQKIVATAERRVITPDQLPLRVREPAAWPSLAQQLAREEASYIARVLRACRGDKTRAAAVLGVDLSRLG